MNSRRNNTPLVVITILVCFAILGVLNYMQRKASPTEAELQAQQQQDQQAATAKASAAKAATVPAPDLSHPIPSDLLIGNPAKAKIKVTIGYTYDDATAQNPAVLATALKEAQDWVARHPDDSLRIVCLDLPPDQLTNPADASVPLGITVNGNPPFGPNANPGEEDATLDHMQSLFGGLP